MDRVFYDGRQLVRQQRTEAEDTVAHDRLNIVEYGLRTVSSVSTTNVGERVYGR